MFVIVLDSSDISDSINLYDFLDLLFWRMENMGGSVGNGTISYGVYDIGLPCGCCNLAILSSCA